ncbi:MAG TPA: Ig domain-containing protein [Terriglobales bacterium]|nr:Ig domain-containing protein [Terriglobales bacterium]
MYRAFAPRGIALFIAVLSLAGAAWAQEKPPSAAVPLAVVTDTLPQPVAHTPYFFQLEARGGAPPYTWSIIQGKLPPGLRLDSKAGTISGELGTPAEVTVTIRLTDSAEPPASAQRELKVTGVSALQLQWEKPPQLQDDGIYGQVKVGNPSKDPYDLTFIIVAVNQIGKAFALGYQHFTLRPQATQSIPFGTSLPLGSYVVHADAVGEIAAKDQIRRARLQTPKPLVKQ